MKKWAFVVAAIVFSSSTAVGAVEWLSRVRGAVLGSALGDALGVVPGRYWMQGV